MLGKATPRPAIHAAAALVAVLIILAAATPASARPLILSFPEATSKGQAMTLEIVAPPEARTCSLGFTRRGRKYGPYRVSLGGPTRMTKWKLARGVRGTWKARLTCGTSKKRPGSLGASETLLIARGKGRRSERFVIGDSFRSGIGSIPERPLPDVAARRRLKPVPAESWPECSNGAWVRSTHVVGFGVATEIGFAPSQLARAETLTRIREPGLYRDVWGELQRCARFPSLSGSQLDSLYKQLVCHARYGTTPAFGGPTWDLEAWHANVPWHVALDPRHGCELWGDVPNAGGEYVGRIVPSSDDELTDDGRPNPQKRAWLVEKVRGELDARRHIPTVKIYNCLVEAGRPAAVMLQEDFLRQYLPIVDPELTDSVCPPPPANTPPADTPPASPPTNPPSRARANAYDNYGSGAVGRAMCRGNPGNSLSMPGGTASQTFTVPPGAASIDTAKVQIDPDTRVTGHATLFVNDAARATASAAAVGDTTFTFGEVGVRPGDQVRLSITFSASFGKIITVYTVGAPGGTFTASNSCPDGAPSFSTSATGIRAVLSGWNQ